MIRIYPIQMAEIYKNRLGKNGAIWAVEMFLKNYPAFKPLPYITPKAVQTKMRESETASHATRRYWLDVLDHLGLVEATKGYE